MSLRHFCASGTYFYFIFHRAEERHKLVTASLNFYKTAEQVCSVLDSLEREYKREDDWLSRWVTSSQQCRNF